MTLDKINTNKSTQKRWTLFNMKRKQFYIGNDINQGGIAEVLLDLLSRKQWNKNDDIIECIIDEGEYVCYCKKSKANASVGGSSGSEGDGDDYGKKRYCSGCIDDEWKILGWG